MALTAADPARQDFKYCNQARDAAASAPRNIAEGFGRYTAGEFAQYLRWAHASLLEVMNHLIDARDRRYINDVLYSRLMNLARAADKTTVNLLKVKQRQAAANKLGRRRRTQDAASGDG